MWITCITNIKKDILSLIYQKGRKMENKKVIVVWNLKVNYSDFIRKEILNSYVNNQPLSEDISDIISYDVVENDVDVRLIAKFI